uniref:Uncharacterized protein n=1 Tax=Schizaphis graminum TaxID=13262 RepID=A0A2S2PS29_SCHGA
MRRSQLCRKTDVLDFRRAAATHEMPRRPKKPVRPATTFNSRKTQNISNISTDGASIATRSACRRIRTAAGSRSRFPAAATPLPATSWSGSTTQCCTTRRNTCGGSTRRARSIVTGTRTVVAGGRPQLLRELFLGDGGQGPQQRRPRESLAGDGRIGEHDPVRVRPVSGDGHFGTVRPVVRGRVHRPSAQAAADGVAPTGHATVHRLSAFCRPSICGKRSPSTAKWCT